MAEKSSIPTSSVEADSSSEVPIDSVEGDELKQDTTPTTDDIACGVAVQTDEWSSDDEDQSDEEFELATLMAGIQELEEIKQQIQKIKMELEAKLQNKDD